MDIYKAYHNFLQNKYTKLYFKIIDKAFSKSRKKVNKKDVNYVYYELHHILPSSIYPEYKKLSKCNWNGVLLTAREHFVCHRLLTKMFSDKLSRAKMLHAVVRLMHSSKFEFKNDKKYFTSRDYEYYSTNAAKEHAIFITGNKHSLGKKWYTNEKTGECKQLLPEKVPEGWTLGRNNWLKEKNPNANKKWYHYPQTNETKMFTVNNQPAGWIVGRLLYSNDKKFYYNPETMKTIRAVPGEQPKGWIPGNASIMGENHWNYKDGSYT